MTQPKPTLGQMERMLYLKALPAFAQLADTELAVVAHVTKLRSVDDGAVLLRQGDRNHATYVVVSGRVKQLKDGEVTGTSERRIGVGALAMFAEQRNDETVLADGPTVVLELARHRVSDVLEEHFSILSQILRFLAREVLDAFRLINRDYSVPFKERPAPSYLPSVERDLDLVERILALRQVPAFARSSLDSVAQYAKLLEQVYIPAGEVLWEQGDPAFNYLHLVHGRVRCSFNDGDFELKFGPPGMPGFFGTLADLPRWHRAVAETPVVALKADREILPDVLEDNTEMAKLFLAAIARRLLQILELRDR